jgi:glycosyltransferase involved in cell wall biosynthesis
LAAPDLDVVIPVFNEADNIAGVLDALRRSVHSDFRVLICYDNDSDTTLPAVARYEAGSLPIELVKNRGRGAHGAVLSGFAFSTAPAVVVLPADDTYNAGILDQMVGHTKNGSDIVTACRFMPGGGMEGCRWQKALLIHGAALTLHYIAGLPTRDPSNGFRMFSRRALETIQIESSVGFTYSIELLVKAHRLGWQMTDVPALWFERTAGASRFRVLRWLAPYLRWYFYAFATRYLRRGAASVVQRPLHGW